MEQVYTLRQDYKVLVRCLTYNQSKYIEDALNGFAMQQTDFPFVCLVMDDCSTDGEQEIIKAWMGRECDMTKMESIEIELSNVIIVPHKINSSCTFVFYLLKRNLWKELTLKDELCAQWRKHSKYEALCEGDDYWVDKTKLQQQVDFLDGNQEYSMCYTQCYYYYQSKKYMDSKPWGGPHETFEDILKKNTIPTLTTLYRTDIESKYLGEINPREKDWKMGDYPRWLYYSHEGKIKFINKCTGVYRVLETSASHSVDPIVKESFIISGIDIKEYFAKLYGLDNTDFFVIKRLKSIIMNAVTYDRPDIVQTYYHQSKEKPFFLYIIYIASKNSYIWKLLRIIINKN